MRIAKIVKKCILKEIPELNVELLEEQNKIILLLSHDKCVSGLYYLDDFDIAIISENEIAKEILNEYYLYQSDVAMQYIEDNFSNLDSAANKIYCKIDNENLATEYDLPYVSFDQFTIIFYLKIEDPNGRIITMSITKEFIEEYGWDVTEKELLQYSIKNIVNNDYFKEFRPFGTRNVIALQRKSRKNASTIILFPDLLFSVCKQLNTNTITVFIPDESTVYAFEGDHNLENLKKILNIIDDSYNGKLFIFQK